MPDSNAAPTESYEGHLRSQPDAVRGLIAHPPDAAALGALAGGGWRRVVFVGSGTSRFAGGVAAAVWTRLLGVDAWVVPTLPFEEDPEAMSLGPDTVVVAISQSGGTLGLVRGVRHASEAGSPTIAVTADAGSPLARAADVVVDARTGPEAIYAKTKGFATTALAACLAAAALARHRRGAEEDLAAFDATVEGLPDLMRLVVARSLEDARGWAERFATCDALAVAGAGDLRVAAGEGALKTLEVAKLPVLDYELEESLHGPFNAFGPNTGLVLLEAASSSPERARAFLTAAHAIGAPTLHVAEARSGAGAPAATDAPDLTLPALPFRWLAPLLAVVPLQALALHLARVRGVDPDRTRYPELYAVFRTKAGQGEEARPDRTSPTPPRTERPKE